MNINKPDPVSNEWLYGMIGHYEQQYETFTEQKRTLRAAESFMMLKALKELRERRGGDG